MTTTFVFLFLIWVSIAIALKYFKVQWQLNPSQLTLQHFLSVFISLLAGAAFFIIDAIPKKDSLVFFEAFLLFVSAIVLTISHLGAKIAELYAPGRGKSIYNIVLFFWIIAPFSIASHSYLDRISREKKAGEVRLATKTLIENCCLGQAEACAKASSNFAQLDDLLASYETFYNMKRKYFAEGCKLADANACHQFSINTGYENYREHELYKEKCNPEDANIPAYVEKPEVF